MKNKQINQLLSVGAGNGKFNSLRKIELPYLMRKEGSRTEQVGFFTGDDVVKVIEHLVSRGQRYGNLKKSVCSE